MPDWTTFAGLTGVVLASLLALSRLTATALTEPVPDSSGSGSAGEYPDGGGTTLESADHELADLDSDDRRLADPDSDPDDRRLADPDPDDREVGDPDSDPGDHEVGDREPGRISSTGRSARDAPAAPGSVPNRDRSRLTTDSSSTGAVLANVAFSQGLFAALLIGAAVYAEIPPDALGIAFDRSTAPGGVLIGTAFGVVLYAANEFGSFTATRLGLDHDEELRELLAPDSRLGWAILLTLVLPTIAVFEEFLFRAALIGALSTGFDLSPWLLAVLSSVAFAVGHGVQGPTGVAVTGALGFALAAAFIYTGSLLVVVVAHYLVNALEFVVHEGLGLEWETTDS